MSKGDSGLFDGTMGSLNSTYTNTDDAFSEPLNSYSDRGIEIPEQVKGYLSQLHNRNDFIIGKANEFSMSDVSIMSRETGVEFARVTIGDKTYLIRGDSKGTTIPDSIINKIKQGSGTLDFHSHPHNDDCIPSSSDRILMARLERATGQKTSRIVTPNGIVGVYNKSGIIERSTISNLIDENHKKALLRIFGGNSDD